RKLFNGDAMGQRVDASVVDDDVEPPVLANDVADDFFDVVRFRDVEQHGLCAGRPRRGCLGLPEVEIAVDHASAVGGERIGDGLADAAHRAGDQGDTAGEIDFHDRFLCVTREPTTYSNFQDHPSIAFNNLPCVRSNCNGVTVM